MGIIQTTKFACQTCKYYEAYHQHPNPNAVDEHYCTKCKKAIIIHKGNWAHSAGSVIIPAACYRNGYYVECENVKKDADAHIFASLADYEDVL